MRKPRFGVLLFVLVVVSLSVTVPGEDLPDTAYDDSEALPYESTPLISDMMSQVAASETQSVRIGQCRQLTTPLQVNAYRMNRTDSNQSAEIRVILALLCTLLC